MTGPPLDVVVVGSANLDLVARTPRLPGPGETVAGSVYAEHPGGKGLNQAVAAARSGARVAFVGAVGDDAAGRLLRDVVRSEGIDDARLVTVAGVASGRAVIVVDDAAENTIVVVAGANATVAPTELPPAAVVLAQLETSIVAVTAAFESARAQGATTILNPAPARALPDELLSVVDVVVANEHEADLLGGPAALHARGIRDVVVTLGVAGVELVRRDAEVLHVDAYRVDAVDTTGAGDAFCGALAARLATGEPVEAALRFAAAAGAVATTRHGAVPAQPHLADTLALVDAARG